MVDRATDDCQLSIIVPMVNEAQALSDFLGQLDHLGVRDDGRVEVIFVDGGSTDESAAIVSGSGHTLVGCDRGRALQMNRGADIARGAVLLFLHVDTRLPDDLSLDMLLTLTSQAPAGSVRVWGRFDVRIVGRHPLLPLVAGLMNVRSRLTGIATGDQGIFVKRATFSSLGGYADQPLMEDIDLSRRLKKISPPICIRQRLVTSGRRWDNNGLFRTVILMWRLRLAYWLGVPARRLAEAYYPES